jgi:hypothetical protein
VGENETRRKRAVQGEISAYKNGPRTSKTHLRYWERILFQRGRADGKWWFQIQHKGRREKLTLGTPVKVAAAARARDFFLELGQRLGGALGLLRGPARPVQRT